MRLAARCLAWTMMFAVCLTWIGCDGDGLFFGTKAIEGNDDTDSGDEDDAEPEPDPDATTQDLGTWMATYSDARIESSARYGRQQYAATIHLKKKDTALTGTGTVYRVFNEGPTAYDKLTIAMTGTISGYDASATVDSATGGNVYDAPTWYFRFARGRICGAYVSHDLSGTIVRSGFAVWQKVSNSDVAGTWASAFSDEDGTSAWPASDRTALLAIEKGAEKASLGGTGSFIEQREGDVPLDIEYNVTQGDISGADAAFTLGGLDLANREMDWYAIASDGVLSAIYAQFGSDDQLIRYGHATWHQAANVTPDNVNSTWIAAFGDSAAASGKKRSDYVVSLALKPKDNNVVSGSGEFLDMSDNPLTWRTLTVQNGSLTGSHLRLDLLEAATNQRFDFDLRLLKTMLVGSYQRLDEQGRFLSRGTAEWRRNSPTPPDLAGTWAASYVDTRSAAGEETPQLALVTVTKQAEDGSMSGTGSLRYATSDSGRRVFDVNNSSIENQSICWVWRGSDLFGDTVWYLRQSSSYLYGAYVNQNTAGNFEAQGSAIWVRAD